MAFIDSNINKSWLNNLPLGGISRNTIPGIFYIKNTLDIGTTTYNFNKNYQFVTSATSSGTIQSINITYDAPFKLNATYSTPQITNGSGGVELYSYSKPLTSAPSNTLINYGAAESFRFASILGTNINDISFVINGFKPYKYLNRVINHATQPNGWLYDNNDNSYIWTYSSSSDQNFITSGTGMTKNPNMWQGKNCIVKNIDDAFDIFNFECHFEKFTTDSYVNIYLIKSDLISTVTNLDFTNGLLGTVITNGTFSKTSLNATNTDGTKNSLIFVANETNTSYFKLTNITVTGTYHDANNNLSQTTINNNIIDYNNYNDASYFYTANVNGATYSINSKVGNGTFKSGIWENGIWNSGWRNDTEVKDFNEISSAVATSDASWKIELRGMTQSVENFNVGDVVSVGNIIAIDINDNRKLLKDYYKIESVNVVNDAVPPYGSIVINLDTIFPYRRIEKDSTNHKIKITKNVWLSGAFFNGYFSGVWNNGLFKGFPLLTEMYNTQWIDGFFNGGHFNSNYASDYDIKHIGPRENCSNGFMNISIITETTLVAGDLIIIELLDFVNNIIGGIYNGVAKVMNVTRVVSNNISYDVITIDKKSVGKPSISNSITTPSLGKVLRYTGSGLIQNCKFYDNNRSQIKSAESGYSPAVFSFNSWMEVNYDTSRSVTLGRDFRTYEPLTEKSINRNNLFGYPTYDILASSSRFRNANTLEGQTYKLGTKYKVYNNFIGDFSKFNEPFNPTIVNGLVNFTDAGWVFSYATSSNLTFNRTESIVSLGTSYSQAFIDAGVTGDELYITAINDGAVLNNDFITLDKFRYSVVEFDIITYSVANYNYTYLNTNGTTADFPVLNLSNLNYDISTIDNNGTLEQTYNKMTYLPITDNVNHLLTSNSYRLDSVENMTPEKWGGFGESLSTKKYEYFYNKTDLMLDIVGNGLQGVSQSMVIIDNINTYEVDMIPFFKYYEEKNIFKGIQIPIQGLSPEIDYLESDFVFIDNVTISVDTLEDSIVTVELNVCSDVNIDDLVTVVQLTNIDLTSTTPTSYTFINAINGGEPGSATCSTTLTSIQWIIPPSLSITNEDTLYPTLSNLSPNPGIYSIKVIVGNNGQTSTSVCTIRVKMEADFASIDWNDQDFLTENSI